MEQKIGEEKIDDVPIPATSAVGLIAGSIEDKKYTEGALSAKVLANHALLQVLEEGWHSNSQSSHADGEKALENAEEKLHEDTGKYVCENLALRSAVSNVDNKQTNADEAASIASILSEIQVERSRVEQIEMECAKRKVLIAEQITKIKKEIAEYQQSLPPPDENEVQKKMRMKLKRVSFIQQVLRMIVVRNSWLLADDKYLELLACIRHPVTLENLEAFYTKIVDVGKMFGIVP